MGRFRGQAPQSLSLSPAWMARSSGADLRIRRVCAHEHGDGECAHGWRGVLPGIQLDYGNTRGVIVVFRSLRTSDERRTNPRVVQVSSREMRTPRVEVRRVAPSRMEWGRAKPVSRRSCILLPHARFNAIGRAFISRVSSRLDPAKNPESRKRARQL